MNITKLKKTLLSLIIVLVGLLPVNVNASSIVIKYDNNPIKEGTTKVGEGNIIFDSTNNILTLDNVNLQGNTEWPCLSILGNSDELLTIKLIGNNFITSNQYGLDASISINFEGPGNLTINSLNAIAVVENLNISNTNINLKGTNINKGEALKCLSMLTVNNSTINIESSNVGIQNEYGSTTINDSTINFKDVNEGLYSGILRYLPTTLSNTTINVNETKRMNVLIECKDLVIKQCNINLSNTLLRLGVIGNNIDIINNSNIELNSRGISLFTRGNLNIADSNVSLTSILDNVIKSEDLINITNSEIYLKTNNNDVTAIWAYKLQDKTLPRNNLIVLDKNLEEINNYKVYTSDYDITNISNSTYNSVFTLNGLPLEFDFSNAAKELHLRVKKADYTGVDTAISSIPKDLSIYSTTSVNSLNAIVNAVVRDLKITEQATVDKYANDINKAINDLRIKAPTMSEGNNQTIVEGNDAIFRSDAKLQDFIKAMVDGKDVDKSNYELVSGSTILTLKKSYLNGLSTGTHTLSIVSKNGTATANFTTKKNSKPILPKPVDPVTPVTPGVPDTSINTYYNLILSLMFISSIGIVKVINRKE
ncbi:MAG: hypothetical protein RR646_06935 [Erysipelotrichaceae bacterium]